MMVTTPWTDCFTSTTLSAGSRSSFAMTLRLRSGQAFEGWTVPACLERSAEN
ncbi:MAG: hypothetical protein Q8O62_14340 [Aequorivita sp.]|nr:hypothetical protein [Aequorivita sp.]